MAISGISSSSYGSYTYGGYSSLIDSNSWYDKANEDAEKLKESTGTKTSSSTSSTSTAKAISSTSSFLMEYQTRLEDLEAAAAKLQTSKKDNVFSNYDAVRAEYSKTQITGNEDGSVMDKKMSDATDDVVDATKDFIDQLNGTISFLSKNSGHSATVAFQLASLQRTIPSDKALAKIGISVNTKGELSMDEDKFREALQKDPELVKDLLGGQFGMAERAGDKATQILDMSVNEIMGGSTASSDSTSSSTSSSSSSVSGTTSSSKSTMSDSFRQFANFARSGAYNLSNYYAVSMLNILV
ncbi:hypothetical protein D7X87_18165 [bacterium D16-54]|nr:hypothetical protein D7X87_18165 [bacterium D16-54]RKJ13077.1 hypothetical protein D7X65_18000 [bacterium D16-56]